MFLAWSQVLRAGGCFVIDALWGRSGAMPKPRSCHSPQGGCRVPAYVTAALEEREARQAELNRQYEEDKKTKVGIALILIITLS